MHVELTGINIGIFGGGGGGGGGWGVGDRMECSLYML